MELPNKGVHTATGANTHLTPLTPEFSEARIHNNLSNGDVYREQKTTQLDSYDSSNSNNNSDETEIKEELLEHNGNYVEQTLVSPPHPQLPKPEPPSGVLIAEKPKPLIKRSTSSPESAVQIPAIGKFFREKSNSLSTAITKRLSLSTKENDVVKQFSISGLKVTVKLKTETDETENKQFKGRITFFSRSNCRDSTAVRSYFRDRMLRHVEINVDVYPTREKELIERTGSNAVPQIFFNEKLFGGLVALNSLRNCGLLEEKMKELLWRKCPDDAPAVPVYGFDDLEEEKVDEMVTVVRVLRQRLPIQDRLVKMKIVKNCFSASEMVEVLIHQFDCARKKLPNWWLNPHFNF
ncbi:putative glutaredoxin, Thioredoxin-like superfamily, winged helix DNA-binding domain superfamily [Helianthus anomalus]